MGGYTDSLFNFYIDMCGGDVGDCFTIDYYGEFQMGIESIGYVIVVVLFINVLWEIRKW